MKFYDQIIVNGPYPFHTGQVMHSILGGQALELPINLTFQSNPAILNR